MSLNKAMIIGRLGQTKPEEPKSIVHSHHGQAYLRAGDVGMLVAPGGYGKSYLLLYLAAAMAAGDSWLNMQTAQGRVLFIAGHDDEKTLHRRLYSISGHIKNINQCAESLAILPVSGLKSESLWGDIITKIEEDSASGIEYSLIIVDSLCNFFRGDENDAPQAGGFMEDMSRLSRLPGRPFVMASHHSNKQALSKKMNLYSARGSSAFVDGCRWVSNIEPRGDARGCIQVARSPDGPHQDIDVEFKLGMWMRAKEKAKNAGKKTTGKGWDDTLNRAEISRSKFV